MNNSEITQTEFDFIVEIRDNAGVLEYETLKLYTMPYITAKLKWRLNNLVPQSNVVNMLNNLSDSQLVDFLKIDLDKFMEASNNPSDRAKAISDVRSLGVAQYSVNPQVELKSDFDKAVEFCIACVDRQRILREENGREKLDKILDTNYWELQKPDLLQVIIDQYSPSVG